MVTGFIPTLVFFMFRTKANGFQVMDIGHYYGLIIIGLSFRLTVCRGLIASIGPIWRICYLIVLCFVLVAYPFLSVWQILQLHSSECSGVFLSSH